MKTTDTYGATLLDTMGSDLTVVNAARVSFDKESEWGEVRTDVRIHLDGLGWVDQPDEYLLSERDTKLIQYLASHDHFTPFCHPQLSFRVKAPIFVARQLQKHQVGLTWNEVSRRYVDSDPEFYVPKEWRARADNVKQGSSDGIVERLEDGFGISCSPAVYGRDVASHCLRIYNHLLAGGVCPEQARMVLPQSTLTEWIWTGSLYAFARVCKQRLDPHAQRETRWVAEDIALALAEKFPVSWAALMKDIV